MRGDPPLNLSGLDLSGGMFSGELYRAEDGLQVRGANLIGANLNGSDLRGARFMFVYLGSANLTGSDLRGATFGDVSLARGLLAQTSAVRISRIHRVGLGEPDHYPAANSSETGSKTAKFVDARADGSTKWERGFDWRAAGVKLY